MKIHTPLVLLTLSFLPLAAGEAQAQPRRSPAPRIAPISSVEAALVTHMREEEKLARDVYLTLGAIWKVPIFTNIAASEQRHMDAVKKLIVTYRLPDPVVNDAVGVFTNPRFQELYQSLVTLGSADLVSAYHVGVMIEELDIDDLEQALAVVQRPDIKTVFQNLLAGSYNHLDAFDSRL